LDTVLRKQQIAIVLYHEEIVPWWIRTMAKSEDLKERGLNFGTYKDPPPELRE